MEMRDERPVDAGWRRTAFWIIFIFAVTVRCIGFGSIPGGVNQDEAMAAVDGWALAQYGTDRFGVRLPVHFSAWQYGQMSVLLSYCMVPFIRLFGFQTVAVRLPALLISCGGVALVYLVGKKLFDERFALMVMALTAINPWHFMQSRWALDCNLFPHVFLLAFYLLLLGFEKRRYLYLSMLFFGLTFYCYGVAVYSVIPFLVVCAAWCLWKKQLKVGEILACVLLFGVVALPEILVMAINLFRWDTIETPLFTMSYFPESIRSNDILLLNFSFVQLGRNIRAAIRCCFLQTPDHLYNALPAFGPLYHISIPFMALGIIGFSRKLFREKEPGKKTRMLALWGFLMMGVWVGATTFEVNVNRINIIFYPLLFMCGYGLRMAGRFFSDRLWKKFFIGSCVAAAAVYAVCFALFLRTYFTSFREDIRTYFNAYFLEAVKQADEMEEYERLYITGHMDWQYNLSMAEILTQYACEIDALYFQGTADSMGERGLLPYAERYHYVNVNYLTEADEEGLYLFHVSELEAVPFETEVIRELERYVLVTARP
ncbi:MAG: glycosyltransferase family 39 protein [Lachnospiraceae bacterium]|nr:glycosyltransferase family 39 protein [Lachnospiraceae bacterium]MCM1237754.1 glycosyltransferase family 39 protein [Lachnospiraceae bacterium]MCM1302766.1 glycosyltransferase family 39 protein [Butyrivibrio sp.]MCM1342488.1 glycosyltransferase family 39 protein [Muribaculaceae bacterium]